MRFIGNLHTAMRATNNEKNMIKELNSLHQESLIGMTPSPRDSKESISRKKTV